MIINHCLVDYPYLTFLGIINHHHEPFLIIHHIYFHWLSETWTIKSRSIYHQLAIIMVSKQPSFGRSWCRARWGKAFGPDVLRCHRSPWDPTAWSAGGADVPIGCYWRMIGIPPIASAGNATHAIFQQDLTINSPPFSRGNVGFLLGKVDQQSGELVGYHSEPQESLAPGSSGLTGGHRAGIVPWCRLGWYCKGRCRMLRNVQCAEICGDVERWVF